MEVVEGFGLAIPAQIDETGFVQVAPLLGWTSEDLQHLVRKAVPSDLPVVIENDANAFAFGESYRHLQSKAGVTLFLVLESGVGGGIIIDGKLFRGGHGLAGEIGHVHVRDGTELEEVLGRAHLERRYRKVSGQPDAAIDGFLDAVRTGKSDVMEIAEDWARDLAQAIVAACRLLDPNRVVLGGRLSALYPLVAAQVTLHIEELQACNSSMCSVTCAATRGYRAESRPPRTTRFGSSNRQAATMACARSRAQSSAISITSDLPVRTASRKPSIAASGCPETLRYRRSRCARPSTSSSSVPSRTWTWPISPASP